MRSRFVLSLEVTTTQRPVKLCAIIVIISRCVENKLKFSSFFFLLSLIRFSYFMCWDGESHLWNFSLNPNIFFAFFIQDKKVFKGFLKVWLYQSRHENMPNAEKSCMFSDDNSSVQVPKISDIGYHSSHFSTIIRPNIISIGYFIRPIFFRKYV